jgi:ABC-type multidrug transport system fused ATPase/permease subunit
MLIRLWPYVRPYAWVLVLDLLLSAPLFLLELAPAWIIKHGLDSVFGGVAAAQSAVPATAIEGLTAQFLRWSTGVLEPPEMFSPLSWLAALYAAAVFMLAGMQFVHGYMSAWVGQQAMRGLRVRVFDHIQSLHVGFFDRYPVGRLVTRATSDVENLSEMFSSGLVALITDIFKMVGFAVVLYTISPELTLVTFSVVPVLAGVAILFRLRIREAYRETRIHIARINAQIQETITGMKVVQLFTREQRNFDEFDEVNALNRNASQRSNRWDARLFSTVEVAQNLTVAIILGYGFRVAAVGTFYIFIDYMRRFFMPLRDLSAKYTVMQSSMASAERIFELLDTESEIQDRVVSLEDWRKKSAASGRRGAVTFENVWFAYQDENWVLEDISFHVEPGEKVAFVGATGAGKSSVINLLTRFYEPQRGRILLDGKDLREIPQSEVRQRVVTVLQDVFLFSGSIADNIRLGREDLEIADLERAASTVEAHSFIETLPDGYQTVLRERGADLSAGQRQLLSFARAVAHEGDVLVLDEATSSIDTETEALIQRGIHHLLEHNTAIAVAHRLSTIQDVDRIYALHKGRIVEAGGHQELMALEGLYYRLYRLQYRVAETQASVAG